MYVDTTKISQSDKNVYSEHSAATGRVIYETRFWRGCVNFEDESSPHCTFYGYVNC